MDSLKQYFYAHARVLIAAAAVILLCPSCKYGSTNIDGPPQAAFKQPFVQPLTLRKAKKVDWSGLPETKVQPAVNKIDLDKLPATIYDSSGFKPLSQNGKKTKINFGSIPEKDLDIDKIPSALLKFKTFILQPPVLVKAGLPRLKNAGDLPLYEFGEMQGLRGANISCVFTDRSGFLWIATNLFLYRYDGENLLQYQSVPYCNEIFGMMEDDQGRIWITTIGDGLEILDQANGTLKITNRALGLGGDYLSTVFQDAKKRIWIAAFSAGSGYPAGNVNIIDPVKLSVRLLDHTPFFTNTNRLMADNDHHIWISTEGNGLCVISPERKKIKYFNKAHGLPTDTVDALLSDHAGRVWVGSRNGEVFELNAAKTQIQSINDVKHNGSSVQSLNEDNDGRIWFGTQYSGLEIIDPVTLTGLNLNKGHGLDDDNVLSMCTDNNGQQWVGQASGLNMIGNNPIIAGHIGKTTVNCIAEDKGGLIWQGSDYGVAIINRKNKTVKHFTVRQGLSNDTVQSITEINGNMFVSSQGGLDIIGPATKTITHLTNKQGLRSRSVTGIFEDQTGRIWIGGDNGVDIYNPKNGAFKHLDKEQGLRAGVFGTFAEDSRGRIWAGNDSGEVAIIDPAAGEVSYLNNVDFLKHDYALTLLHDNSDNMWIGTSKGLFVANPTNKTLTTLSSQQGLLGEGITSLLNNQGRMYAATNRGISIISPLSSGGKSPGKWHIKSFGSGYGIGKTNTGYSETDAITRDGLYWWGDAGITIFDLSKADTSSSVIHVTGIKLMDQRVHFINQPQYTVNRGDTLRGRSGTYYTSGQKPANTGYINQPGIKWDNVDHDFNLPINLQLPYNQNFLQFQYVSADLSRRDTAWYLYKLIGVDDKWSEITNETTTKNYYNLSPGKYIFEVSTKNRNGDWGKPGVMRFSIIPPWWQTWWAIIIGIVLLSGIIWGFVYLRSLQLIKEKRVLEHKVEVRTEEVLRQKEEIEAQRDHLEQAFSDLKSVQSQLIQSEKMASLGELTAGIAHEIQNPLNFVNNFSEVNFELLDELGQEIEKANLEEIKAIALDIKENEKRINMHGKRAGSIVKGMLEHSRGTVGKKELTNLNTMADEYLHLAYHGAAAKDELFNCALITNFDENLPRLNIVPQDIGRVLLNLFNNAFYAVNQKQKTAAENYQPQVSVTTELYAPPLGGRGVVVKVLDNGVGIPDAIKDKIMQPFFTTKPTGEGTGLGLSLAYDMVVKGHGGKITVETREGDFTEIIVSLPLN